MNALWLVPVIFIFLASALIWFLIGCTGKWWLKVFMMFVTLALAVWAWLSIDSVLGYPKPQTLEKLAGRSATLYWTVVQEPSAIYLWVKMDGDKDLCSYKLPYSRPLHEETDEAKGPKGEPVHIRFGATNARKGHGEKDGGNQSDKNSPPSEIYILPPAVYPDKLKDTR